MLGSQQQVAAAYLTELRGTSRDGQPATEPAGSMCAGGVMHQAVDTPLATQSTRDRTMVTGVDMAVSPLPPEKLARTRQVAAFLRALLPRAATVHELRMPVLITACKRDRKGNIVMDPDGKPEMVIRPLTKTEDSAERMPDGSWAACRPASTCARSGGCRPTTGHPTLG